MRPISVKKQNGRLLDLFKNADPTQVTGRLEDFSTFCLNNKKVIN